MGDESFRIECCSAADRVDALRRLHEGLSPDQQAALPAALELARVQGEDAWDGLFVARVCDEIRGAVWVQVAPGRTAVVWPPAVADPVSPPLMRFAARFLDERRIVLAQILMHPDSPLDLESHAAGGFDWLVDLAYLALEREFFPSSIPHGDLAFVPAACEFPDRLAKVLLATYEETLDCPQLNGLRESADILAGYAAQGEFSPDHWFLVERPQGRDVGVLLLTAHGAGEIWELTYMGVLPELRGQGLGRQIVQFAASAAASGGAERLVLAVDDANGPGLAMYRAAGFVQWDRRAVFARIARDAELASTHHKMR